MERETEKKRNTLPFPWQPSSPSSWAQVCCLGWAWEAPPRLVEAMQWFGCLHCLPPRQELKAEASISVACLALADSAACLEAFGRWGPVAIGLVRLGQAVVPVGLVLVLVASAGPSSAVDSSAR